jgi:N-acyl-D-aspartate/D-glutamate deacylase
VAKSYDLVIRGGRVIDGTGEGPKQADVAIRGDTIIDVGKLSPASETPVLEAAGLVIAPGFIDAWAGIDPFAPAFPGAESKLLQGITTEVAGALGQCPFPIPDGTAGGDDLTGALGAPPGWPDARSYLLAVARAGTGIHRAFYADYGQIRTSVIGPTDAPPTRDEARQITKLVESSLEAGCIGLAFDLTEPPSAFAGVDELVEVSRIVSDASSVVALVMKDGTLDFERSFQDVLDVISRTGVDLVLPGFRIGPSHNWDKIDWVEKQLRDINESGKNITLVIEPYVAWTGPLAKLLPPEMREGGPYRLKERLASDTFRTPALTALKERAASEPDYWTRVRPIGLEASVSASGKGSGRLKRLASSDALITVADVAASRKRPPEEVCLELIALKPARLATFFEMNEGNRERELSWDFVTIGSGEPARPLDDPRAQPPVHPRARGAFARLIRRYVREKKLLELGEAIRKITSFPADRFGLGNRGRVQPNHAADLVLFRADTIADSATFGKPEELPIGVDHVMVGGRFAVRDGRVTGARQGNVLRSE